MAVGFVLGIASGLHDTGRRGPFPTELTDDVGKQAGRAGPRVRHRHRAQPPLRLVRFGHGSAGVQGGGSPASPSPSSTCWTVSTRSRFASATIWAAPGSTTSRPARQRKPPCGRSIRPCLAGRKAPVARGPGLISRQRDQVHPRRWKTDRGARRDVVHQSGARRHNLVRDPFRVNVKPAEPSPAAPPSKGCAADEIGLICA